MNEIQKAIYLFLSGQFGESAVFDHVPDNKPNTYTVIGDDTATEADTDDAPAKEATITIYHYATGRNASGVAASGFKNAKALADAAYNALHLARLEIETWRSLRVIFEFEEARRDNNGIARQVVQRYRIHLTK